MTDDRHHFRHDPASSASSADAVERVLASGGSAADAARAAVEAYMLTSPTMPAEDPELGDKLRDMAYSEGRDGAEADVLRDAYHSLWTLRRREEARRLDPLPLAELSKLLDDKVRSLGDLYALTEQDWILEIHHVLTEPVCPTVVIRPEGSNALRYAVHADTIAEGIMRSVDLVHRDVVMGERIVSESPITNPDDRTWPETSRYERVDDEDPVAVRKAWHRAEALHDDAANALLGERATRRKLEARIAELEAAATPSS